MRIHQEQLNFRRAQLTGWANSPKPEKARLDTLVRAINRLRDHVDDTLSPREASTLSAAINRIRQLLESRRRNVLRSYLPGRRRPGKLDRPLDL